jgi:hypothetical protein
MEGDKPRSNVVGMGAGVKWTNGEPTGEPAIVVLVSHKVPEERLSKADVIPAKLQDMKTDVLAVGQVFAGNGATNNVRAETLTKRMRPAKGGYSVGHFQITAGTIGTCVYDLLPGASTDAANPAHGAAFRVSSTFSATTMCWQT